MDTEVLYTTQWNSLTRRPVLRHRWLTVDEAREAYESGSTLEIVDAAQRDEEGNPIARWVLGTGPSGRFRAQFFTPGGSVWRSTDYDAIDGRLWRWISVTYVYPDTDTRYLQFQYLRMITETFRPDGTGTVKFDERGDDVIHTAKLTDAPVDGFWLDRPAFGDWTNLSNPDYGVPTDTTWTPPA